MREPSRNPIPTALICVLLLLMLVLSGGIVGIMYSQLKALQSQNQNLNTAMAAQQAKMAALQNQNAELSAIIEHQWDRAEALKVTDEQLRARLDVLNPNYSPTRSFNSLSALFRFNFLQFPGCYHEIACAVRKLLVF